jgi:hypothetical protein
MKCPHCGSEHVRLRGEGNGFKQYICDVCNHIWTPNYNKKEYEKSLNWDQIKCRLHPTLNATYQVNPPIGGFFCNECAKQHQRFRIQNIRFR